MLRFGLVLLNDIRLSNMGSDILADLAADYNVDKPLSSREQSSHFSRFIPLKSTKVRKCTLKEGWGNRKSEQIKKEERKRWI